MFDHARRYEIIVRPRGRTPADEYFYNGNIWIEGREGNNYTIDIHNNTSNRALFIVSVDGLDILNGSPAGPNSQGYVVNGFDTVSIPGWKLNNQEAAEFFFSRTKDSYVNAIGGSTANTGVIGAMVFSEYQQVYQYANTGYTNPWVASSAKIGASASTVRAMAASIPMLTSNNAASANLGTGFGNALDWQTTETTFRRANPSQPDAILALYYNSARNLEKMGIRLRKKRDVSYQANPFPAYSSSGCKPPDDWQK